MRAGLVLQPWATLVPEGYCYGCGLDLVGFRMSSASFLFGVRDHGEFCDRPVLDPRDPVVVLRYALLGCLQDDLGLDHPVLLHPDAARRVLAVLTATIGVYTAGGVS